MRTLYVVAFPKSGSTWLTRLLADALRCRSGASIAADDHLEPAAGIFGNHNLMVRKGHYKLTECRCHRGLPVNKAHNMRFNLLPEHGREIIFLVRDPRDIAVSSAKYHGRSLEHTVRRMINGRLYSLPRWDVYVNSWLERGVHVVLYENLWRSTTKTLSDLTTQVGYNVENSNIQDAVRRQSMGNLRQMAGNGHRFAGGNKLMLHLMRKGEPGDWQNHLRTDQENRLLASFGHTMGMLGYV